MALDSPSARDSVSISQINVTPLVDVMLVLLIIFMVTAPIIQQGIEVNLPAAKGGAITGYEDPLIVSVARNGNLYLNDNPVTLRQLGAKLKAVRRIKRDKEVYLRADENVRYGIVVKTIAEIKEAGILKLGMITRPLPQQ